MNQVIRGVLSAAILSSSVLALAQDLQSDERPAVQALMPAPQSEVSAELSAHSSAEGASHTEVPSIVFHEDGTVSLDISGVPLSTVLKRLSESGQFELVLHPVAEDDLLSGQFEKAPWREVFAQLLFGWRYAIEMDQATGQPSKLVLLSFETGEYNEAAVAKMYPPEESELPQVPDIPDPDAVSSSRTSLEEAMTIAAALLARQEDPLATDLTSALSARAALEKALADENIALSPAQHERLLEEYAERLLALGLHPDPRTLEALAPAVNHADVRVRAAAVRALREGAAKDPQAPVLSDVLRLITSDPDPAVRREAFEVYSRWADPSDVLPLAQSLGREPGPVQDLAVREWIRIEQELEQQESGQADQQFFDPSVAPGY